MSMNKFIHLLATKLKEESDEINSMQMSSTQRTARLQHTKAVTCIIDSLLLTGHKENAQIFAYLTGQRK